jgi:multiple sugar transport system permease protein
VKFLKKFIQNLFFLYIPLIFILLFVFVPIYWSVVTSLKVEKDIMQVPVKLLPKPATFDNFRFVWNRTGFSRFFINTLFVSAVTAAAVVLLSIMVAYGLSRFKFKGRRSFMMVFIVTQLVPYNMLIIPLFVIFKNIGLINSLSSLIITYTTVFLPFNSILMKGFIDGIPYELEEAAMIDGCSRVGVIFRVLLPLLLPGIVAISSFAFLLSWNEYILPVMFITSSKNFVVSVGINYMIGQNVLYYGALAAGSLIALSVPMIIFSFIQKYLVKGLSSGAVKN